MKEFTLQGWMHYREDIEERDTQRIVIPASVEDNFPVPMIVDTGAPWCILRPSLSREYELDRRKPLGEQTLQTWDGPLRGILVRADVTLHADEGEDLTIDATFFVPKLDPDETWLNPNFIGYKGLLQRIRCGIDPFELKFWFGRG